MPKFLLAALLALFSAADFGARYEEVKGLVGRHVRVEG